MNVKEISDGGKISLGIAMAYIGGYAAIRHQPANTDTGIVPISLLLTAIFVMIAFKRTVRNWAVGVLMWDKRKDRIASQWKARKWIPSKNT